MPRVPGLRVVRSSIHGYGIFATRDFEPDDVIAEVEGVLWRDGDDVDDTYSLWVKDGVYFDMVDQTRWINHSCDPNAGVEVEEDETFGARAHVVALRKIKKGEEICYDYAFPAALAEPCHCGAVNCRRFIVDEDELHLVDATRFRQAG